MSKSWVLLEITDVDGEKKFKPLAGTEDKRCINRALASMKLYKDETIKAGRVDETIIHTSVVDNIDYNSAIDECLNPDQEDEVDKILSLVNIE